MPTILTTGPYRFFFYTNEGREPPHVHVQRDRNLAKFWLEPPSLARSSRFRAHELRLIGRIIAEHEEMLLDAWHEFFAD